MSSNFENYRPKLRTGHVIPQGSRIIFETDNPFNQIVLPMALADLILLCSGQFSMREIVAKIYRKQGAVPFRSILRAMHLLHQGGFLENGHELILNTQLHSWMEPPKNRWSWSWRFGQRIVADRKSPIAYYCITLAILVGAILGLQMLPSSPLEIIATWLATEPLLDVVLRVLVCSSILQSVRYLVRGIQLLLLTGKAYNVSLRLTFGGPHLHIGHETNDLFDNRLYTTMFHISQIFLGWFLMFCAAPILGKPWLETVLLLNMIITFLELNPFVNSDGLRLIQTLIIPRNREIASWHFESTSAIRSLNDGSFVRDLHFVRICATWGSVWLFLSYAALYDTALVFGPAVLNQMAHSSWASIPSFFGLLTWLLCLFYTVQAMTENILSSAIQPQWRRLRAKVQSLTKSPSSKVSVPELIVKIQDLPLFSHFHENNLKRIIENSQILDFRAGSFIIIQGDPSRDLFVLLSGAVEVTRNSDHQMQWLTELGGISIFGEAALLGDAPRGAQVVAKGPVMVLKIPVSLIRELAEETQTIRHLDDFRNAILVNQFFASSPVFRSLSNESIDFLCSRGALEYFDKNQLVFNQGDEGDSIYLILRGAVDVEIHGTRVKRLAQGNFFGEIALIANLPRTATVIAIESSVMFKVSSDSFWEVLVQHIDLGVFIETISENRLIEDLKMAPPPLKPTGTDSVS